MTAGSTPATPVVITRANGSAPSSSAPLRGEQEAGGAVVEAGGVAGGDGASLAEGRPQFCELLQRGVGARPLVGLDRHRLASAWGLDRDDLLGELAGLRCRDRALMAAQREGVLV